MSTELTRLASSIGGHYDRENGKILTNEEMILDSVKFIFCFLTFLEGKLFGGAGKAALEREEQASCYQ